MKKSSLLLIGAVLVVFIFILGFASRKPQSSPQDTTSKKTNQMPDTTTGITTYTVTLTQNGFNPPFIKVAKGSKIVWKNESGIRATVDSDNHPDHLLYPFLNLGSFENGSTLDVIVNEPGKYSYHNHYDASQTGTINVTE